MLIPSVRRMSPCNVVSKPNDRKVCGYYSGSLTGFSGSLCSVKVILLIHKFQSSKHRHKAKTDFFCVLFNNKKWLFGENLLLMLLLIFMCKVQHKDQTNAFNLKERFFLPFDSSFHFLLIPLQIVSEEKKVKSSLCITL